MTGIFYGSSTGSTELLAGNIAKKLGVAASDVHDVASVGVDVTDGYDLLLLGSSTWGSGELQDDWYGFVSSLKAKDLAGKKVALFGSGDSGSYPDTFCDAIGVIRQELTGTGCTFIGEFDAAGYAVQDSLAFASGRALGLAADDDEPAETPARMERWIESVKTAL